METSVGFTDVGLLKISKSVRAYAYLILSSQASAGSGMVGNTASTLTAQSAFLIETSVGFTDVGLLKISESVRAYAYLILSSQASAGSGMVGNTASTPTAQSAFLIETSVGFTDVGLLKISESVRAYAYLILSSQASAGSGMVGNTASTLTAQSAFLNNFEDIVNRRVDIREDIKRHQDTLSYSSSKVNYSVGEHLYMLPSDMNLKIRSGTVGYNNKILISNGKFILGKNDEVNSSETPVMKSHKGSNVVTQTVVTHKDSGKTTVTQEQKMTITHEEEKIALILSLTGIFTIWYLFQ